MNIHARKEKCYTDVVSMYSDFVGVGRNVIFFY